MNHAKPDCADMSTQVRIDIPARGGTGLLEGSLGPLVQGLMLLGIRRIVRGFDNLLIATYHILKNRTALHAHGSDYYDSAIRRFA